MKSFLTNNFEDGFTFSYGNLQYNKAYRNGPFYEPVIFPSEYEPLRLNDESIESAFYEIRSFLGIRNSIDINIEPNVELVQRLHKELAGYEKRLTFYFDISSTNNDSLQFWEPGSPTYEERKEALIYAHENKFNTLIFCVPFYDETVIELVKTLSPFVNRFMKINSPLPFLDLLSKPINLSPSLKNKLLTLKELMNSDLPVQLEELTYNHSTACYEPNYLFPYRLERKSFFLEEDLF